MLSHKQASKTILGVSMSVSQTTEQPPVNSTNNSSNSPAYKPKSRRWLPISVLLFFVVLGLSLLVYYLLVYRYYETTDDAYIKADVTWVMPRIMGEITQLNVVENQTVQAGDVLLTIEDKDIQARLAGAKAALIAKQAAINVQNEQLAAARAKVAEAQAGLITAEAQAHHAAKEQTRYRQLVNEGVSTRQHLDAVTATYQSASATVVQAQAAIAAAKANVAALQAQRNQLDADITASQAQINLIDVDAQGANVTAPISGVVGSLSAQLGNRVSPQSRLLAIVPLQQAYIIANYKETQITHMHVGQSVNIELDAYPDLELTGTVASFAPASGAEFSLLAPDNATGNFNKVVQRIPVRININNAANVPNLRPGLSAVVTVDLKSGHTTAASATPAPKN